MDSLNLMHDFMSNTSNLVNVPPQDIEVFLQNGVSTVGGIMDVSRKIHINLWLLMISLHI